MSENTPRRWDVSAMISLHGLWSPPHFYLWGERPRNEQEQPYALSVSELHAAVGELSPDGLLASIAEECELTLWLPCVDGTPIASTTDAALLPTNVQLQKQTVPALSFSAADTIDLLLSLPVEAIRRDSPSLWFWQSLARYMLSLLARQQFVPDLRGMSATSFVGQWRIFVAHRPEMTWLERFVHLMPRVCRTLATPPSERKTPVQLVDSFLAETTEAFIRRCLSNDPFYEQIHQRAVTEGRWELRWLSSLLGPRRKMSWPAEEGAEIVSQIHSWIGQLEHASEDAPPILSFTLVEPETDEDNPVPGNWRVRFDLSSPETGEELDLEHVWSESAGNASLLTLHLINRREHLQRELARASRVFPPMRDVLNATAPTGVDLDTAGAHAFLREWAPLLKAQGFSVDLPAWATELDHRIGLSLNVRPTDHNHAMQSEVSLGAVGLGSMLNFDWRIAIGNHEISIDEFEAITAGGAPLIRIHGRWVDVDPQAASQAMAYVKQRAGGSLSLIEAMRLAADTDSTETGLPIVGMHGTGWLEQLLDQTPDIKVTTLPQPGDFAGELRPYQRRGLSWMHFMDRLGIGACLADDMGLGKTIQLISLMLHERQGENKIGPTLLFAPMSVVGNWDREIQRFGKRLRVLVHHGPDRLGGDAFVKAAQKHDVVVTTYGLANRDLEEFNRVPWYRIALDEAQKIKNPSANQTIAIRSLSAPHRLALTGTPLENHLSELWSIMEMLNPGLLGPAAKFRTQFAIPVEKMGDQERAAQLRRLIHPFILRRLKSDPQVECDLPEKMEMRVYCNLTPEQAGLYERTVRQMLNEIDKSAGIRRRGLILATLTKLKQICNHPVHLLRDDSPLDNRSGKCERLVEMMEEAVEEGDAALVFTQYKEMGDLLHRLLTERLRLEIPFMHGGTTAKNRDKMVSDFQDPASGIKIFLLSLKAGGFGLNLTKANHVFHFDRWWNPAVENQATDRAHRIGQTRRVQVHKFVCIGTIEDRIDRLLTEKSALADLIVGSGDDWLTGLSTQELKEYLHLSTEAVAEA